MIDELFNNGPLSHFKERVDHILELQEKAKAIEDPSEKKKQEGSFRRMLDNLYWEILEDLCLKRLDSDDHAFEDAEKLLVNFGLLSREQLDQQDLSLEDVEKKLKKFNGRTTYDDDPIYTLSEWACVWQMNSELFEEQEKSEDENNEDENSKAQQDWIDDEKAQKFFITRINIYKKLLPLLQKLPGANANFLKSLLSGEFDKRVEMVLAIKSKAPEQLNLNHRRLISVRNTFYDQLKASINNEELLKLVHLLEKISAALVQRMVQQDHQQEEQNHQDNDHDKLKKLVSNEVALLKSLLPIGGMEGREFFTSPILKNTEPLIHKKFVGDTLAQIHQCDPHIPKDLPVIIIPYRGSGFFEWDKNSLIIPVSPSVPQEEAIIRAVGNYKILTDQLDNRGEMKRLYEKNFDKGGFKNRFLQDYVQWVTHITLGHRKIMNVKKFDFFQDFIGPNLKNLLAPQALIQTPKAQLRKKIRDMLTKSLSQEDYLTIASCFWLLDDKVKATQYADMALTAGMPNPRVFLTYGYTLKATRDKPKANQMFKNCLRYYKNTLWGTYAARELERN